MSHTIQEWWVACTVEPGMFEDERTVVVLAADARKVSMFVPKQLLREGPSRIRVEPLEEDANRVFVRLPQPPVDGPQALWIEKSRLQSQ